MGIKRSLKRLRALPRALSVLWNESSNRGQKVRRTIQFLAWVPTQRWLRPRLLMRMDNGLLIRARTTKILVNRFESPLSTFVLEHALPGGIMVDIGASVGMYSLQVAPRFDAIICVEPHAPDVTLLHQNLHLNWRELPQFEVHEAAAGEEEGELSLLTNPGDNFVPRVDYGESAREGQDAHRLERKTVPCRTVDSIVAGRSPVHFIKIDVEGFEPQVLRGARETIAANPNALLQLEGTGDRQALLEQVWSLGLTIVRPDAPEGRIDRVDQLEGVRDFFAVGPDHPLVQRDK